MNPIVYDNLALMAEYEFRFGGSQRLLSAVSKRLKKEVYIIGNNKNPDPIWDIKPIYGIPEEPIIFSIVVDKYKLRTFYRKEHIKFCHSGTSLENFVDNIQAKEINWLTHRKRVYDFWNLKGFNIDLIRNGYIVYDKLKLEETPSKRDQGIFISRICPDKCPDIAIDVFQNTGIPLYLAGNNELVEYVSFLKDEPKGEDIIFVPPNINLEIDLITRDRLLAESKVLVHCSNGGIHDYLEYSILDGLIFNCIPLCITKDIDQFSIINEKCFGRVVNNIEEAENALKDIIDNYEYYVIQSRIFMN